MGTSYICLRIKWCGNREHCNPGVCFTSKTFHVHFTSSFILGTQGMRQDGHRMGHQSIIQSFKPGRHYDLRTVLPLHFYKKTTFSSGIHWLCTQGGCSYDLLYFSFYSPTHLHKWIVKFVVFSSKWNRSKVHYCLTKSLHRLSVSMRFNRKAQIQAECNVRFKSFFNTETGSN